MNLNANLCDDYHIQRHVKSFYARGNTLIKRFKQCIDEVKNYLFKTFCSSIYGCVLLCNFTISAVKRCTVAYNDVYRYLFNIKRGESMSNIYVETELMLSRFYLKKIFIISLVTVWNHLMLLIMLLWQVSFLRIHVFQLIGKNSFICDNSVIS